MQSKVTIWKTTHFEDVEVESGQTHIRHIPEGTSASEGESNNMTFKVLSNADVPSYVCLKKITLLHYGHTSLQELCQWKVDLRDE